MDRRMFFKQSAAAVLTAAACKLTDADVIPKENEMIRYFDGFQPVRMETSEAIIHGVIGGSGPPLLLLHGWPQSHHIWHKLAPMFAKTYTVIATDLRGYGESSKPADGERHSGYSKRAMALDQVEVMRKLGFHRFALVGHDRGGRVAHRMALDYPDVVTRLAVVDIVPTQKLYATVTKDFATVYFHWFFLIQPSPLPETLLSNNAEFFLRNWAFAGMIPQFISEELFGVYLGYFQNPATLHALCEDYRAAATIDLEHDQADIDKKIQCPVLALWGNKGAMGSLYDVVSTWKERALNVQGKALDGGHYLPEQMPEQLFAELARFLSEDRPA
jgi:haloacetate dehalogenase